MQVKDARVENLDAREHQWHVVALGGAGDAAGVIGRRVAAKACDQPVADFDGAVALARGVGSQHERRESARAPVRFEGFAEVDVGGELAVDDDEGVAVVEESPGVADARRWCRG